MSKIKIDCAMITRDPAEASEASKRLEDLGYDGAYTFEGPHEPFLPLAAAALATKKLELLTSIAVAFSRNPMTLANLVEKKFGGNVKSDMNGLQLFQEEQEYQQKDHLVVPSVAK